MMCQRYDDNSLCRNNFPIVYKSTSKIKTNVIKLM